MFERFTPEARSAVNGAQDEARLLRQPFIGPEHLLISLAAGTGPGAAVLKSHAITAMALRDELSSIIGDELDSDALAALGIDLEQVRVASEANLGPGALSKRAPVPTGHIWFSKPAKKLLELALREAVRLRSGEINSGHLLLGLLRLAETGDREAPVARLLRGHPVGLEDGGLDALRSETEKLLEHRAA